MRKKGHNILAHSRPDKIGTPRYFASLFSDFYLLSAGKIKPLEYNALSSGVEMQI